MGLPLCLLIYISSTERGHSGEKWKTHIYITVCSSHVQLFVIPWTLGLLCPLDFPEKNSRVGCRFLLQIHNYTYAQYYEMVYKK